MQNYSSISIKDSITTKLLKSVFLIYIAIAISVITINVVIEYNHTKRSIYEDFAVLYTIFEPPLSAAIWNCDNEIIQKELNGMIKIPILVGIKVEDSKGMNLASIGTVEEDLLHDEFLIYHKDIFKKKFLIGKLVFYSSSNVVFNKIKLGLYLLFINSIIKSIALWIIFLFVGRYVLSRPLEKLTKAAAEFAKGNLNEEIDENRKDEIGVLARFFSFMRNSIKKKIDDLHELNNLSEEMAKTNNQKKTLNLALEFIKKHSNIDRCSIWIMNPDNELELKAFYPDFQDSQICCLKQFKLGEGIMGIAAIEKRVIYIPDTSKEILFKSNDNSSIEPQAIICIPIFEKDKVVGVMNCCGKASEVNFESSDEEFLLAVSRITMITNRNIESEKKYRSIFENAIEGMFQTKPSGKVINANQSLAKTLGYNSVDELIYSITDLKNQVYVNPQDRDKIGKIIIKKGFVKNFETQFYKKDKSIIWVSISTRPVFNSNKKLVCYEGSLLDISERILKEKAERERELAEKSARVKTEFLANMSHEIRNPLNAIIGFTALSLKTELSAQQKDYIAKVNSSSKLLLGIINDILDFSKIEAGKLNIEKIPFEICEIIDNLSNIFLTNFMEKGIDLILSIEENVPKSLMGDPLRIGQILINLVSNAFKFTDKGNVIVKISLIENIDNKVKLKFLVKDSGIGIPNDKLSKLFAPFVQADDSTARKYGGTGLGLSICKKLVEMMNGKIWAESEVGIGTTFYLILEFNAESLQKSNKDEDYIMQTQFIMNKVKGIKVLLTEDNRINQQIATELLKSAGINVDVAENGKDTLFKLKNTIYDVILLDIQLPDMNGYEVTQKIRNMEKSKQTLKEYTTIIAMTGSTTLEDKNKCLDSGMDDYTTKPIETEKLFYTISKWIK
ncbi:MAG: response regulator [Desulfobacterales bacterium]|nr:response regulator [Desulfobacterales bacterium]